MAPHRKSPKDAPLLEWEPDDGLPRRVPRNRDAATVTGAIARSISEAMAESGMSRQKIAAAMSAWLGEQVSVNMLNAYASPARKEHKIPADRLIALLRATGQVQPLELIAAELGLVVVSNEDMEWIELGRLARAKDEVAQKYEAVSRRVRGGRP